MSNKWLLPIALFTLLLILSCDKKSTSPENTAPTATYIVNPDNGSTDTVFTFDASSSVDEEDDAEELLVRWDWENDGTWDTEYRTLKTISKQFSEPRTYITILEVLDTEELTDIFSDTINVAIATAAPTAIFSVTPESGTSATVFTFDASSSADEEDNAQNLQVRWDWENDGTWDTQYTIDKTATHSYIVIT